MIEAAALGLLVSGLGGLLVPPLIARIPEPAEEPAEQPDGHDRAEDGALPEEQAPPEPAEVKVPYAEIAEARGLRWRTATASGLAGALLGATLGWDWSLLFLLPLVPVLVALSVVDWRTRLLPTWLVSRTYVGLLAALVLTALLARDPGGLVGAGWGWLVAGASYFVLWFIYPRGLGYGDVRLSGVLGLALGHLGWAELLTGLYSGFLLGGVGGGLLALIGVADRKGVPFGPFMVLGALVGVVVGPEVAGRLVGGGA
ncbi:prepilin peptidase [Nocardioides campestrisoli]|uniref:prepilin peptidase n=1 Tax=Nocardioides campestrisoli TaxID=2736757 RepID=UPI00163DDC01|nr:A24 family peptidase [Nocardioides campestrisoli]